MPDPVECRSDGEYAGSPLALNWEGERIPVTRVIARWRTPAGRGFRVETEAHAEFELFYDEVNDVWNIYPIRS